MKKATFFSLLVFCAFLNCFSQDLKQNVIASAGGVDKAGAISLEWTLGEFAVETITATKNLYTQGFHQPILMVKSFHSPPKPESSNDILSSYKILLAPNPVQSFVNVFINSKVTEKFSLTLYDMSGKKVMSKLVTGSDLSIRIEMGHYSSGIYLMDIRNDAGTMIKAFKIVKAG
jgi:hypothetical protein